MRHLMQLPAVVASGVHARVSVTAESMHYRRHDQNFKSMVVKNLHSQIAREVTRHSELFEVVELPEVRSMGIAYELQANMHAFSPDSLYELLRSVYQRGYADAPETDTAPLLERIAELEEALSNIARITKRNT